MGGLQFDDYEYPDDEAWSQASRRKRYGLIAFAVAAVLTLAVGAALAVVALGGGDGERRKTSGAASDASSSSSDAAAAAPITQTSAPPPTTSPPAPPSPTAPKSKPAPKETVVPPKPPKPSPEGCIARRVGTQAPKSQVRTLLGQASTTQFWGSRQPQPVQDIRVPLRLLYAIAEQESGWQSDVIACDGGIGVMQVMPNTVSWMNQRFGTSYDVNKVDGNVMLGAQYLAWLFAYFGEPARFNTLDPGNSDYLNAVISAYNVGPGEVDITKGAAGIPNRQYVNNVRALMVSCKCDNY